MADATARVLWVSAGPHTLGRYERFDLRRLLAEEASLLARTAAGGPTDTAAREEAA